MPTSEVGVRISVDHWSSPTLPPLMCSPVLLPVSTRIQDEDIKPLARYLIQYLLQGYPQEGELFFVVVYAFAYTFRRLLLQEEHY